MKKSFIYLISQSNGAFKCGFTTNIKQRMYLYNTHTGQDMNVLFVGYGDKTLESIIQSVLEKFGISKPNGRRNEFIKIRNKKLINEIAENIVYQLKLQNPFSKNENDLYDFIIENGEKYNFDVDKLLKVARKNKHLNRFGFSLSYDDINPMIKVAKREVKKGIIPIKWTDRKVFKLALKGVKNKDIAMQLYMQPGQVSHILNTKYCGKLGMRKPDLLESITETKYALP